MLVHMILPSLHDVDALPSSVDAVFSYEPDKLALRVSSNDAESNGTQLSSASLRRLSTSLLRESPNITGFHPARRLSPILFRNSDATTVPPVIAATGSGDKSWSRPDMPQVQP